MNDKLSIRKTAARMQCNKITVFLLRHKVLECLSNIRKNTILEGKTEADEVYKSINLKGTKPEKMPRKSKKRSSKGGSKRVNLTPENLAKLQRERNGFQN